jgi:hypothetical protein
MATACHTPMALAVDPSITSIWRIIGQLSPLLDWGDSATEMLQCGQVARLCVGEARHSSIRSIARPQGVQGRDGHPGIAAGAHHLHFRPLVVVGCESHAHEAGGDVASGALRSGVMNGGVGRRLFRGFGRDQKRGV